MRAARGLLRDAAALLDANPRLLRAARPVRSFHDGARWMRLAMRTVRGRRVPRIRRSLEAVGWRKYGLCVACSACFAFALVYFRAAWLLPSCVPYFYLCEVQRVFDVPLAIDGETPRGNGRLLAAIGGAHRAVLTVMALASVMLFGGLAGRGFVRSWCLGCAAVVLWYERVRDDSNAVTPGQSVAPPGMTPAALATIRGAAALSPGVMRGCFEFGANAPLFLRRERVTMPIDRPIRLLFASDLHLGNRWSPRVVDEIVRHVRAERPDALLLGGDLADSRAGLPHLRRLLSSVREATPTIAAVLGNHDRWEGGASVVDVLDALGVVRLDRRALSLGDVTLVGSGSPVEDRSRTVRVAHDPANATRDARLTLAGHLHGGQCVLWNRGAQQWPGWLVNRRTMLRHDDDDDDWTLIVSRGAADSLPVRFNCPREVVLLEIDPAAPRPA